MNCPHCQKVIADKLVRSYVGRLMGRAKGPSKARDPEKMRQAVLKRWARKATDK